VGVSQYFFDIFNGRELVRDEEGQECATLAVVRFEAEESARELAAQTISRHAAVDSRELRVRNGAGIVVVTVALRDVLEG
jgi:hypothetical protein